MPLYARCLPVTPAAIAGHYADISVRFLYAADILSPLFIALRAFMAFRFAIAFITRTGNVLF